MPLKKRITSAYLFDNGNLAVFDEAGNQVGELQGEYSIEKHRRILLEAVPGCDIKGFSIIPDGFIKTVNAWILYFETQNLSWEEIQNL